MQATRSIATGITLALAVLASAPALAQTSVMGVIPERTGPGGIADVLESNWNVTEFDCLRRAPKGAVGNGNVLVTPLPQGQSLISLPRTIAAPPLADAAGLFAALGGQPVVVSVGKLDTATDSVRTWDGEQCSDPEPGCPGTCFCIDPAAGLGYLVNLTTATTFTLAGNDGALNIALAAPGQGQPPSASGTHWISLPFDTPLVTASELFASIDFQSGAQSGQPAAVTIQRLLNDGTFQVYNGDPSNDFALERGIGYGVQVFSSLLYTPPFADSGQGPTLFVTARSGGCVGRQLALTFDVPDGETDRPVPFELALACSTDNRLTAAMGIDGGPLVDITDGNVEFGPFSSFGSESALSGEVIPTLGEWGLILFTVVLLSAGVFLILGRLG